MSRDQFLILWSNRKVFAGNSVKICYVALVICVPHCISKDIMCLVEIKKKINELTGNIRDSNKTENQEENHY